MLPQIPDNAPFSSQQRAWLNGYFAGLFSRTAVDGSGAVAAPVGPPVLVLFGSQTGTAENLARKTAKKLSSAGFAATCKGMDEVDATALADVERLLLITSTCGEGEMPDNAQVFWDALAAEEAPRLEGLLFSVLALGDSSYADFCQAGRQLDARLADLGGERMHARMDADVDFEEPFEAWLAAVTNAVTTATTSSNLKLAA